MLPLVLDQGLPVGAAARLRDEGWDVVHVHELHMSRSADAEILEFASREARTVVTLDSDFPALLALAGRTSPSVVLLRLQGLGTAETVQLVRALVDSVEADLVAGAVVVHTGSEIRVRRLPIGAPVRSGGS